MTEPKSMDPERLTDLRECLAGCDDPTFGFPLQSYTRELLADRDHSQADALAAKREAAEWREQTLAPALFRIADDLGLTHSGDDSPDWLIALLGRIGDAALASACRSAVAPSPMTPKQLALIRRVIDSNSGILNRAERVDLLADRDHWEGEAKRLAELAAKLEAHLNGATNRAKRRRAELKEAKAEIDRDLRWRKDWLVPYLQDAGIEPASDGRDDILSAMHCLVKRAAKADHYDVVAQERDHAIDVEIPALVDEVKRWRARCPVDPSDVEAAGVTWAKVKSWMSANGWSQASGFGPAHGPGGEFVHWKRKRSRWLAPDAVCVYTVDHAPDIVRAVESLAQHHERVPHDVLDEMATMGEGGQ